MIELGRNMESFVAYSSKAHLAAMGLGTAVILAVNLWMLTEFSDLGIGERVFAVLGPPFWICALVVMVRRFFDNDPQLVIGPQGIMAKAWSDELIPWTEITRVSATTLKNQNFIGLNLRDPSAYPGRGLARWAQRSNRALSRTDILISMTGTTRRFKDAKLALEHFSGMQALKNKGTGLAMVVDVFT